jgi:uncharacterized membrane protein YphA (DoxX/SURF4 family)
MRTAERTSTLDIVIALLRIVLGAVFIFASLGKIADPGAFAASISGYRIVTGGIALLIATVLPWIEFLSGLGLLLGLFWRASALLALLMLILFTIVVLSALWRGLDISCGCYTQDPTAERLGWWKIGENAGLIVMSYLVLRQSSLRFTLERLL